MIAESFGVSRSFFSAVLNEDRDRHDKVARARAQLGWKMTEEALKIADETKPDRDEVAVAKLRIDTRMALAAKLNRAELGDRAPNGGTIINIQQLHIDALRQLEAEEVAARRQLPVKDADIESIEEDQPTAPSEAAV